MRRPQSQAGGHCRTQAEAQGSAAMYAPRIGAPTKRIHDLRPPHQKAMNSRSSWRTRRSGPHTCSYVVSPRQEMYTWYDDMAATAHISKNDSMRTAKLRCVRLKEDTKPTLRPRCETTHFNLGQECHCRGGECTLACADGPTQMHGLSGKSAPFPPRGPAGTRPTRQKAYLHHPLKIT